VTHTVLIVDDSKLARMAVAKALKSLRPDWKWAEAGNAAEALEQVQQLSPEVVLLDFNMPGKDGVSLAAELRTLNPHISVAVVSANRQLEVVRRTAAAGATFLPKPLTEPALEEFLSSAGRQPQAPSHE